VQKNAFSRLISSGLLRLLAGFRFCGNSVGSFLIDGDIDKK